MSESIEIPGSGSLETRPALEHLDLVAPPVARALTALEAANPAVASLARVSEVDPELADTEVLTQAFGWILRCLRIVFWLRASARVKKESQRVLCAQRPTLMSITW